MTTRLTLVRHATTEANVNRRFVGQVDPPLNEQGEREATELAKRLAESSMDLIVTSDLQRAVQTANAIADSSEQVPSFSIR